VEGRWLDNDRRRGGAGAGGKHEHQWESALMHRSLVTGWGLAATVACAAYSGAPAARPAVRPGIDVLLDDSMALVRGRRVGLVTNQTGVDAHGMSDVERLRAAGVQLVALFSPEHGFRGAADPGAAVASTIDSATGLPIYSLYGRTASPTDSMLAGVDVMLVDLQDAGARYYTYIGTATEVMKAAVKRGMPVVILDRPNPIGGVMAGNVLDTAFRSFVGLLPVPMRHGLTLGELARFANDTLGIHADLAVVPVAGWRRHEYYDETGLPFVRPSPNLPTLESLIHYPGLCLFEGTNLSVGRGTDHPFEQIGAPWLDADAVLSRLTFAPPPGVAFERVTFTPSAPGDGKYADSTVPGIRLKVLNRSRYDPVQTAVMLLAAIRDAQPGRLTFITSHFDRLAGTSLLRVGLQSGLGPAQLMRDWEAQREAFRRRIAAYVIYSD
jgi:uncharacterized protein YbbC (DUF1343 family)